MSDVTSASHNLVFKFILVSDYVSIIPVKLQRNRAACTVENINWVLLSGSLAIYIKSLEHVHLTRQFLFQKCIIRK